MCPTSNPHFKAMPLQDALASALPSGFACKVRYIHTPPTACDALFSPLPGEDPEKTRLSSHFLTVSIVNSTSSPNSSVALVQVERQGDDVFVLAIEVLIYHTKSLTTVFVSKADTTGYLPNLKPSRTKIIVTSFLQWLITEQRRKHQRRNLVVSLFARAQNQYLFPGSIDHGGKRPLDDRQLIRWWARVIDPIFNLEGHNCSEDPTEAADFQGYITVPGQDGNDLRSYFPAKNSMPDEKPRWKVGDPLEILAEARGVNTSAPPRSLLPRFPDDPKARFMQDLDNDAGLADDSQNSASPSKRHHGKWNAVSNLQRFWEAMEFRQECSSGRVVGFLWLVISPAETQPGEGIEGDSQESQLSVLSSDAMERESTPTPTTAPKKTIRRSLKGIIVPRKPRLKGGSSSLTTTSSSLNGMLNLPAGDGLLLSQEGYDKAMQTLLQLDFANLEIAARSTSKWVAAVCSICGLSGDWADKIVGTTEIATLNGRDAAAPLGEAKVNDLEGMVRKKRKAAEDAVGEGQADAKARPRPTVNVLTGGMVRKKAKS